MVKQIIKPISGLLAASCCCAALAAPRTLEGQVNMVEIRITATAIDPLGPAPGVGQPYGLFGYTHSRLCHTTFFCAEAFDSNESNFGGTAPYEASAGYGSQDLAFAWSHSDMENGVSAHIEFHPDAKASLLSTYSHTTTNIFEVQPNTIAALTLRVSGELGAANPEFDYGGWLLARSHLMPRGIAGEPMEVSLTRQVGTVPQAFDDLLTVYAINDSDQAQAFQWEFGSLMELTLPVPEPAGWGMLLAGLGLLLIMRRSPLTMEQKCWNDWQPMRSCYCTALSSCLPSLAPHLRYAGHA